MKSWLIGILVILLICGAMYSFVYFIVIPKTARVLVPSKWKNIPPGQKRETYVAYLGKSATDGDMWADKGDLWFVKKDHYNYYLNIHYSLHSTDTIGATVSIKCRFYNALFDKTEIIQIDSLE